MNWRKELYHHEEDRIGFDLKTGLNRRHFLKASGFSLCATGLARALSAPIAFDADGSSRPNILFIMTDQQTADGMSCAGNPLRRNRPRPLHHRPERRHESPRG